MRRYAIGIVLMALVLAASGCAGNKELLANVGHELFAIADESGVDPAATAPR